jgi:hypothetical protein
MIQLGESGSVTAAGEQVAQWVQDQSDRALARQRATADNAKLVATFIAATAGTLVATARTRRRSNGGSTARPGMPRSVRLSPR